MPERTSDQPDFELTRGAANQWARPIDQWGQPIDYRDADGEPGGGSGIRPSKPLRTIGALSLVCAVPIGRRPRAKSNRG